ncbi:MAG: RNA polymerase sporulation sigma factor SigK [Bacillota bacterium]
MALTSATLVRWLLTAAGYLTGSNTFPQPLSEAEEGRCLQLMESGNLEARNRLIEHNLRLVAHIVKKFDVGQEDTEDLISIGTVGLIKAINTFNQDKGTRLATYAARCIENEILMHFRSLRKLRGEVFLHDPIGVDREGNEITFIDILGSDPDEVPEHVGQKLEEARLARGVSMLEGKEREVLVLRYGLEGRSRRTQREIAKRLGISRSYVSRIEKRALQRARHLLDEGACL